MEDCSFFFSSWQKMKTVAMSGEANVFWRESIIKDLYESGVN